MKCSIIMIMGYSSGSALFARTKRSSEKEIYLMEIITCDPAIYTISLVENQNDLELDFKVFFFADSWVRLLTGMDRNAPERTGMDRNGPP